MRCLRAKTTRWMKRPVLSGAKTCDIDGSEFPKCEGGVDDLLIKFLSLCGVEKAW